MPVELKHRRKGLINVKNNDQKCFLWCHVRHINPVKDHPGRIKKTDRDFANNLNYDGIEFPMQDLKKVEVQNNICINVFCYENKLVFPVYISDQIFKSSIEMMLNLITCILKSLTHLCFIQQKVKIKNGFVKVVYSVLVVKMC